MLSIWIIHRDSKARAALARISGVDERAVLASPTDRVLDGAEAATVVLLGLTGDFELELDFVHRHAAKLADCSWILLPSAGDVDEARRLFDTLPAEILTYPPDPRALRRALRAAVQHRHADPLSARQGRAELRARFARWFGDLELPELIRALDPRLSRVPMLIHGEEGTGRGLLARYVHVFAGRAEHDLVQVACRRDARAEDLLKQMAQGAAPGRGDVLTFYFEDVDRLPAAVQRRVRDWIEFGLPEGALRRHGHRFMASASSASDLDREPGLDPRLGETLSGLTLALPSLRERPGHIEAFVEQTAEAFASAHGERARDFGAEAMARLRSYPWPGNLHELEAVVTRTLSFSSADPIEPIHLRFPSDLQWLEDPLAVGEVETVPEQEAQAPEPPTVREPEPLPPLDDLADIDPGARPGHEDDLDLGRVAQLGEPAFEISEAEEESLFPPDDLEDVDEEEAETEEEEDLPFAEIVPEVEAIEDAEVSAVLTGLDDPADVNAEELLPELEPLGTPIRPLPAAQPDSPTADALARDAFPFDEAARADALDESGAQPGAELDESIDGPLEPAIAPPAPAEPQGDPELQELIGAIAHEVRNPLVSIRTFSELLPDHYDDQEFRTHFRELVVKDVERIDRVVTRLQTLAEGAGKREPVDVARMLDRLLDDRRATIQSRRLLVLKELDHTSPMVHADPDPLRDALSGLLDRAIDQASERGDVYLASKHNARGADGRPTVRILIRHTRATRGEAPPAGTAEILLDLVLAKRLIEAQGGRLTVDDAEANESVIVVDLPAA